MAWTSGPLAIETFSKVVNGDANYAALRFRPLPLALTLYEYEQNYREARKRLLNTTR